MQLENGTFLFSPKDLLAFLGCEHCTALDLERTHGRIASNNTPADPYLDLLKKKGVEHEQRYLATLRADGKTVLDLERAGALSERVAATRQAMIDGVDVVYQGALRNEQWHGYSDFLLRIDTPSKLGTWSYEVADTKLARTASPKHVVQLCLYSELVAETQELLPAGAHVVLGDGSTFSLRLQDYIYYVSSV